MSKQSEPGDKTGWKRNAGPYSRSYEKLTNTYAGGDIDGGMPVTSAQPKDGNGFTAKLPKK